MECCDRPVASCEGPILIVAVFDVGWGGEFTDFNSLTVASNFELEHLLAGFAHQVRTVRKSNCRNWYHS